MNDTRVPTEPTAPAGQRAVPAARPLSGFVWLAVISATLAVGWFYGWTTRSSGANWHFPAEQRDYYNLLVDGWLDGHLYMKVDVPETLLHAENPYDPAKRPAGIALHDASFYRGHYYLYFGAVPALVTLLPFRLISGCDLPLGAAAITFTFVGFVAMLGTWLEIRRRYFSVTAPGWSVFAALSLGVVSLIPVVLRRTDVWELPIAAGYCFFALSIWAFLRSTMGSRLRWLAVAGLCAGLAIGSRPTYLVILAPLALGVVLQAGREDGTGLSWAKGLTRSLLAVGAPLALIGALLAWHNYARYGDPLEFGQKYQLSSMYEAREVHFGSRYVSTNAWLYLFSPARWTHYFPFLQGIVAPKSPPGYGGYADVYGLFANVPLVWLALLAPLAGRRAGRSIDAWLVFVSGSTVCLGGFLLFFFGAHGRYMVDFAPGAVLLAMLGLLVMEAQPHFRLALRLAVIGAFAYSIVFAALFSITATNIFAAKQPGSYARLGSQLNRFVGWTDRALGRDWGLVEGVCRFDPGQAGDRVVLLVLGRLPENEAFFYERLPGDLVRFGYARGTDVVALGPSLPIAPGSVHRLQFSSPTLFPPADCPLFAGADEPTVGFWTTRVHAVCDGRLALEAVYGAPVTDRPSIHVGRDLKNACPPGWLRADLADVSQGSPQLPVLRESLRGCLRFRVRLSESPSPVVYEVARRRTEFGAGAIFLHVVGDRVSLGWTGDQGAAYESPAWSARPGVHELELFLPRGPAQAGSLLPFALKFDSDAVPTGETSAAAEIAAPSFSELEVTGQSYILSAERFVEGADPLSVGRGPLILSLRLPSHRTGERDPLVTLGRSNAGDFLFVHYVDETHVRFGLDHWGSPVIWSEPLLLDYASAHQVEIGLDSLERDARSTVEFFGRGSLEMKVDGRIAWQREVDLFWPHPTERHVGSNPIGGSACSRRFTGEILSASRAIPGGQRP